MSNTAPSPVLAVPTTAGTMPDPHTAGDRSWPLADLLLSAAVEALRTFVHKGRMS